MSKIAIFFGPEKGAVNRVADKIRQLLGAEKVEMVSVANATAASLKPFDKIIFGISTVGKETWDSTFSNNDWAKFMPEISKGDFQGKTVAIFGLGDHITYAANFVDSMGQLARELQKTSAHLVGQVPVEGYEFEESAAIIDGMFVGLPVDEDFEPELTDARIAAWVALLKNQHGF
ncbi:MAG TPA: flavodoxin [Prolixibacteraceae bacterium]|nr:flavodoxin [Prolixibacteraceae bacterium]